MHRPVLWDEYEVKYCNMQIQISPLEISSLLQATLRSENAQQTYEMLERARRTPGFCIQLLVIADDKSTPIELRQTALVTLKTTVDSFYVSKDDGNQSFQITESDKESLRLSIVDGTL